MFCYNDYGTWIRQRLPGRIQKLSVDAGFSCPNRDGTLSDRGCSYCNNKTFTPAYCDKSASVSAQLAVGKRFFARKYPDMHYLAYFQSFTNTYAPVARLHDIYEEALREEGVVGLVIGTRPDCISDELLDYLHTLSQTPLTDFKKDMPDAEAKAYPFPFIIVEYGIESTNDSTLRTINRGHDFACCREAVMRTHRRGIITCGHVILGLPGEDAAESLRQAPLISALPLDILKLHQLQIIRDTPLATDYARRSFPTYTADEYISLVARYLQRLRPSLVIERFVSQSPPHLVLAPHWGLKNYEFVHRLTQYMCERNMAQGQLNGHTMPPQ